MKKRILGIDPALTKLGYAVLEIDIDENTQKITDVRHIAYSEFRTKMSKRYDDRLSQIFRYTQKIINDFEIDEVAMENSFHNPRFGGGGTSVREAIGVAKAAIQLSHKDIPIHIYPPHVIKKAATNNTKADKLEVATEICNTLGIKKFILERTVRNKVVVEEFTVKELIKSDKDHVTDALSAAYTRIIKMQEEEVA